ncbi:helix-turn-helix domain-containing protein [Belliella sp. R4-6]|uniref:Helix-turn-helix domain-containing protein n=1 Tax=Belliella alkalica TaxID=1730871 RepID=A0ABS9V602_9BACT|nr:helix-turn-helix domain-containing protein [Belliella alkalica]
MDKKIYRIASLLADHGLDNKDLAELIKVSDTTVTKWCKHHAQPSRDNIYKICKVLKVNPKDLVVTFKWPDGPSEAEIFLSEKKKNR